MGADHKSVYEPILLRPAAATALPRFYTGGFEQQKHSWATVDRRSQRIRLISYAQIALGFFASFNYLWLTNIFSCFVGLTGILAFRSEKLSWTLVYLLVCMVEFVRNVLLAPHLYERYCIPHYQFTGYEYFQVAALLAQDLLLIPAAYFVVFAAAATTANPLW